MKALKEKRISLRSLWRRGLVILSLFALVFASCNTSGDDSGSSSGPVDNGNVTDTRIIERVVISRPTKPQYFGQLVDLTGVTATVYYHVSGGGNASVEDPVTDIIEYDKNNEMFEVYPRVVTGGYSAGVNNRWVFNPYPRDYVITCKKGGSASFDLSGLTVPIDLETDVLFNDDELRNPDGTGIPPIPPGVYPIYLRPGFYANGLQLTGVPDMVQKTAIVDDDVFNFAGLTLNASYTNQTREDPPGQNNPNNTGIHNSKIWKKIDWDYVTWSIMPEYINPDTGKVLDKDGNVSDKVCPGYIYITVGDYVEYLGGPSSNTWSGEPDVTQATYGITIRVPLNEVYTVKTIEVVGADVPAIKDYYFWQRNIGGVGPNSWGAKLAAAKAKLNVTYTGGKSKQGLEIEKLVRKERIWYNDNPTQSAIDHDFDVIPIAYPFTKKGNPNPFITVYYRGAIDRVYVNVFTALAGLESFEEGVIGDASVVWGDRDNDLYYTDGMTEAQFVKLIEPVKVEYATYHNDEKRWVTLTWAGDGVAAGTDTAMNGGKYTTNFNVVKPKIKKDGVSKAVTILHEVNSGSVMRNLGVAADNVYTVRGHSYPYFTSRQGQNIPAGNVWKNDKLYQLNGAVYIFNSGAKTQKKKGSVSVVWSKNL